MFEFLKPKKNQEDLESSEDLSTDQAVILSFDLDSEFGSEEEHEKAYELEDRLSEAIGSSGEGFVDGHDFGDSECTIYVYGEDAQVVFKKIEPLLNSFALKPIRITIRLGEATDPDAKEITKRIL